MRDNTTSYTPTPRMRRMVAGVVCVSLSLLVGAAGYAVYLAQTSPAVQEEALPLDPEETVLFYQPEEYQELAPLAECPAELDYLRSTRYLA